MRAWNARDAHLISRQIDGQDLNGEVDLLSPALRVLADRLDKTPRAERGTVMDHAACCLPDGEAFLQAVLNADPRGPMPEADADEDGTHGWPPLRLGELPAALPFPLDVFPDAARDLIEAGSEAIGCPPDFLALPALAIVAGVVGRSVSLLLKDGYFVPSTIFGACVGPPSDGKSPALRLVTAPCWSIDEALRDDFDRDLERWKREADAAREAKPKRPEPRRPRPRRCTVDNVTIEALIGILEDNVRGVVMPKDELTAFILGLNQYKGGRGSDRADVQGMWTGSAIKRDRVANEDRLPISCAHPCLSLVGGITPDMLGEMVDARGRADGFLDRFLFAYPEQVRASRWTEGGVPEAVAASWEQLVRRVWERPMALKDERCVPHVAMMGPAAAAAWADLYNRLLIDPMNADDFPPSLRGPWGKLRDYAGRLTLVLACMHHAAESWLDPNAIPTIDTAAVERGFRLIPYFQSHARRVHAAIAGGVLAANAKVVQKILEWLRRGRLESFSVADLKHARRWIEESDMADALRALTGGAAIRPRPVAGPGPKGGRPPSPTYDVNPAIHDHDQSPQTP